jgi:hypothetical protein
MVKAMAAKARRAKNPSGPGAGSGRQTGRKTDRSASLKVE